MTVLHALCSDMCWRHTPIDALLQFKTNEDLFRNEMCKVTFGVKYTFGYLQILNHRVHIETEHP